MINPGDALLKEGMPVPEPNTISSANAFTPIENALHKIITKYLKCNSFSYSIWPEYELTLDYLFNRL